MSNFIGNFFKNLFIERPYRDKNANQLATELTNSQAVITQKWTKLADTEKHRKFCAHIIGLEKWGQARLQVPLGEPLDTDEYDKFRPADDLSVSELREIFVETRKRSIELLYQLDHKNVPLDTPIHHNQMGDVTIRGWIRYFVFHGKSDPRIHGSG